jgi:hypothetical protein
MSHSQTKKITKFKSRHSEGHKKYSAQKELDRQTLRQAHHQERGKVGHTPHPRKILK